MLTKIRLENFKSWRELDLDLSNLTILFGTNSSGKSSVLQSLLLLRQTAMGFDRLTPINLGGSAQDYVDFGSYKDLVFGDDEQKLVGIGLEWNTKGSVGLKGDQGSIVIEKLAYTVRWRQQTDRVIIDQLKYDVVSPSDSEVYIHLNWKAPDQYDFDLPYEARRVPGYDERFFTDFIPLIESCYGIYPLVVVHQRAGYVAQFFSEQFEILVSEMSYLGPLRRFPQRIHFWKGTTPQGIGPRGENTIEVLLWAERFGPRGRRLGRGPGPDLFERVAEWLVKMDLVSDFQVKPVDEGKRFYEVQVQTEPNQVQSSLADVGFGISQVLPVVTLLFFIPQGSIVLLEQPELHLHPSAQAHLADLFLHVAEKRNLQLIIESHSEHLLRRLQRRIAEQKYKFATPDNIKMYFCEIEHGESIKKPVEINKYGQIANWPKDFFGDIDGDLEAMSRAALQRRRQELEEAERH